MIAKKLVASLLVAGLMLGVAGPTFAANNQGSGTEITLGFQGTSDKEFDNATISGDASIGFFLIPWLQVGARQSLTWISGDNEDFFNGATRAFVDVQFNLGNFAPFIGANIGYQYGDGINDTGIVGPEAGLKYYVGQNDEVFLYGRAEYFFFFEDSDDISDQFEDGSMFYALGIGWRL